jgi:phage/plasmid-like protein (TIGR03299 family)
MADSPFAPQNLLEDGLSLEDVAKQKGLDFEIISRPSLTVTPAGELVQVPNRVVLMREDTLEPLAQVSNNFKVVQPMELLETYDSFLKAGGCTMRSAGIFRNGARYWAMAETKHEATLPGGDEVKSYLFLASANDGSLATTAIETNLRMFCWNVAPTMVREARYNGKLIKVPHHSKLDIESVKLQLAAAGSRFMQWVDDAKQLAKKQIDDDGAVEFFQKSFGIIVDDDSDKDLAPKVERCLELFSGEGAGSTAKSARGTVWGAYNALTEYIDHHTGAKTGENRFQTAMTGAGAKVKMIGWQEALRLAQ